MFFLGSSPTNSFNEKNEVLSTAKEIQGFLRSAQTFARVGEKLSEIAGMIAEKITGPIKSIASFLEKPLQGISGFIEKGFDMAGLSPATSPAASNVNSQQSTKINAPITVMVPEGTDAAKVGGFVQTGIKEGIESIVRQTNIALEPKVEF